MSAPHPHLFALLAITVLAAGAASASPPLASGIAAQAGLAQSQAGPSANGGAQRPAVTYPDYPGAEDEGPSQPAVGPSTVGSGANQGAGGVPPNPGAALTTLAQQALARQQAQANAAAATPHGPPNNGPLAGNRAKLLNALNAAIANAYSQGHTGGGGSAVETRQDQRLIRQALQGLSAGNQSDPAFEAQLQQALQAARDAGLDLPAPDSYAPPDSNDPDAPDPAVFALVTYGDSVGGAPNAQATSNAISAFLQAMANPPVGDLSGGLGSVALAPIYAGYVFTPNQNGSSVIAIASTQTAGPSKLTAAPSSQVQGPSKVITAPSSQVQGPSSVMTTPSSFGDALCGR